MMPDDERTFGEQIISWIEAHCRCPEGALVGQPLKLMQWQRDAILKIYDNPATTRRAIISVGRKSGKTTFAACLLLVHFAGPATVANSSLFSAALSRDPLFSICETVPQAEFGNGSGGEQHHTAPLSAALESEIAGLKQVNQLLRDQLDDVRDQRDKWEQSWWWPMRRAA